MTAALAHPTHDELALCAKDVDLANPVLDEVRRHLEDDRCDECSAAVYEILTTGGVHARKSPLLKNWLRPIHVNRRDGLRIGATADYQLVCAAGPYALDVLVRDDEQEQELHFVGQVTRGGRIHEPVPDLPLRLIGMPAADGEASATDEFGEFAMATAREGIYGLRLGAAGDSPCVMVWEGWDA